MPDPYPRVAALTVAPQPDLSVQSALCTVCAGVTPVVEPVKPHLVLADLTGCSCDIKELAAAAAQSCGQPVYIGVGCNCWIARCAALQLLRQNEAAHRRLPPWQIVSAGSEPAFLAALSVYYLTESNIEDAGAVIAKLIQLGIHTIGELAAVSPKSLTAQFGHPLGPHLCELARGIAPSAVKPLFPPAKATVWYRVPPDSDGITNAVAVDTVLVWLCTQLTTALAQRAQAARRLCLEIQTHDDTITGCCDLSRPTMRRETLLAHTRRLCATHPITAPVQAIALHAANLETPPVEQGDIFADNSGVADGLKLTLHNIHSRFGRQALKKAAELPLTRRELVRALWEQIRL